MRSLPLARKPPSLLLDSQLTIIQRSILMLPCIRFQTLRFFCEIQRLKCLHL